MKVSLYKILNIIDKYNMEEPKKPESDPSKLILVDNDVTLTVKNHLGNLIAVIAEGHWGTGKTWSALKLYHDFKLEDSVFITYIPARYVVEYIKSPETKVEGVGSTLATVIAKGYCRPQELAKNIQGVMTNAPDTSVDISKELSDVLKEYYLIISNKKVDKRHILLIDEVEESIKSRIDLDALSQTLITLRKLFDEYGSTRLMLVLLLPPLIHKPRLYDIVGSTMLSSYIRSKLHEDEHVRRYILDKIVFINLEHPKNTKTVLSSLGRRIIEVVKSELESDMKAKIEVDVADIDEAVDFIVKVAKWIRFGRDLLVKGIAQALSKGINEGVSKVSLKEEIKNVVSAILGFEGEEDIVKVLSKGELSRIDIDMDHVRELTFNILEDLKRDRVINSFYMVEERKEKGFTSFTYAIKLIRRERGRENIIEIPITFWLRFTSIGVKGVHKANRIFEGRKIIVLTVRGCKHGELVRAGKRFSIENIVYLPYELAYYVVSGNRIMDEKIRTILKERFDQEIKPEIISSLRRIAG